MDSSPRLASLATLSAAAASAIISLAMITPARAGSAVIYATDRGWYRSTGAHTPTNLNYLTGRTSSGNLERSFFVFDITPYIGSIITARLDLFNPAGGFNSPDPSETLSIYQVTTPISSLTAGTGGTAAYADLADGTLYGSATVTAADTNRNIEIFLNASAIAEMNQSTGPFAFGGTLTTLGATTAEESLFAFSTDLPLSQTQLILATTDVPEPSVVMGLIAMGIFHTARRDSSRRLRARHCPRRVAAS